MKTFGKSLLGSLTLLCAVLYVMGLASCASRAPASAADSAGERPPVSMDKPQASPVESEVLASPSPSAKRSERRSDGFAETFMDSGTASIRLPSEGPREGGLNAGYTDDHKQYNYFLNFIEEYRSRVSVRDVTVSNRIVYEIVDREGRPFPNVELRFSNRQGKALDTVMTNADGRAFVTLDEPGNVELYAEDRTRLRSSFDPSGPRVQRLELPLARAIPSPPPLDVVFILDTTGSMGGEIERLRTTIDIIRENLDLANPRPQIRFGLVLYKDRGDSYVSRVFPLTSDMDIFRKNLSQAEASGGGDTPEELESALKDALGPAMGWNRNGGRIAFIITDAPAHMYEDGTAYSQSTEIARSMGIRIHSIGTGGLPLQGEYQLRQIAWRTRGSYIFLTYGERGESEGGKPGAVSHHTGDNWTAERLETIIIRLAREELAALSGVTPSVPADDWFRAIKDSDRSDQDVLDELFGESLKRLIDYSSFAVKPDTAVSLTAIRVGEGSPASQRRNAELFHARLLQSAVSMGRFKLVERDNIQAILEEVELALSAAAAGRPAANLVELLGSELLIMSELREVNEGGDLEVYLRLVRVSTAEILSVSRARIDRSLALK